MNCEACFNRHKIFKTSKLHGGAAKSRTCSKAGGSVPASAFIVPSCIMSLTRQICTQVQRAHEMQDAFLFSSTFILNIEDPQINILYDEISRVKIPSIELRFARRQVIILHQSLVKKS